MSESRTPRTKEASTRAHEFMPYVSVVEEHVCADIESDLADALAEVERLRKDAERYRFILFSNGGLDAFVAAYHNTNSADEIDAAIDAALATQEPT